MKKTLPRVLVKELIQPFLASVGLLVGVVLLLPSRGSGARVHGSFDAWFSWYSLVGVTILCGLIVLWWLAGFVFLGGSYIFARLRPSSYSPVVPSWAPKAMKTLAASTLGVSALMGSGFAHASAMPEATLVAGVENQLSVSQLLPRAPAAGQISQLLPEGGGVDPEPRQQVTVTSLRTVGEQSLPSPLFPGFYVQGPQALIVEAAANSYSGISPFFGAGQRISGGSDGGGAGPAASAGQRITYTVVSGDTLWSIAEKHLPATASGAEIFDVVRSIQLSNQDSIPTLDALIFPGQTIHFSL